MRSIIIRSNSVGAMTIPELAAKKCVPCKGTKPMTTREAELALGDLRGWSLSNGQIEKEFRLKSYRAGLDFVYAIGRIAEEQDHHPDILIRWRRVKLTFSTHVIKGLSQNDFIMAAKAELEYQKCAAQ